MHSGINQKPITHINTRKFTLETPTPGKTSNEGFINMLQQIQKINTMMPNLAISSTQKYNFNLSRSEFTVLSFGLPG
jgi:hypothetical protein